MIGLSIWHLVILLLVVVLVFGTGKLKTIGRDLGGAIKDFKNTMGDDEDKAPPTSTASTEKKTAD